jgi:adenine-specific DNA-methyltransferase
MKPRLELLKSLLHKEGVLFVQIDENEHPYLKILLHDVFGRKNEVGEFVWQKKKGGGNDSRYIATEHEYIIAVAKDKGSLPYWFVEHDKDYLTRYNEKDDNGRYFWDTFMRASGKQYYSITCPDGTILDKDRNGQPISWLRSEPRFKSDLEKGEARIIKVGGKWSVQFKQYLSDGKKPRSIMTDMPTNSDAKDEMMKIFGDPKAFDFPKPEGLIKYILSIMTEPGDIVLDSFLGSGTTSAVAHKMGRRWIGVEMGNHAYTHCKVRMDKVIDGEQGGISKSVGWNGGGGYRFFELAPTLILKDKFGLPIISPEYNAEMLAMAVAKNEGYVYAPDAINPYKQGNAGDKNFIYTTTGHITASVLDGIATEFAKDEFLIIFAKSLDAESKRRHRNITVKHIPPALLGRCEFGAENYNLPVTKAATDESEVEDV